jgi:hypothetical protein
MKRVGEKCGNDWGGWEPQSVYFPTGCGLSEIMSEVSDAEVAGCTLPILLESVVLDMR